MITRTKRDTSPVSNSALLPAVTDDSRDIISYSKPPIASIHQLLSSPDKHDGRRTVTRNDNNAIITPMLV